MAPTPIKTESVSDDASSTWTAFTPPKSATTKLETDHHPLVYGTGPHASSIPWPGSTFIISCLSSEHVITFLGGRIILAPPGSHGSFRWQCVEVKGWLGFRDPVSGKFLGYDKYRKLVCMVEKHDEWERFCVRLRPDGGYVLLMTDWEKLAPIVCQTGREDGPLEKKVAAVSDGMAWKFIKVC